MISNQILKLVAEILSKVADFELRQNASNADFELSENASTCVENTQTAPFCQVPEVSPKSNIKPFPNPPSYLVQGKDREEGREENKALPRKASTLKPARARESFEEFWNAYPKRINKQSALRKFEHLLKLGVDQKRIIDAAHAYAKTTQSTEKQFIKSPDVWLNKGCYDDELPLANGADHPVAGYVASVLVKHDTPQWEAWEAHYRKVKGRPPPTHNGGWHFPTEWPPDAQ